MEEDARVLALEYARIVLDVEADETESIDEWLTYAKDYPDEVSERLAGRVADLLREITLSWHESGE
jgi:hypothetical protein